MPENKQIDSSKEKPPQRSSASATLLQLAMVCYGSSLSLLVAKTLTTKDSALASGLMWVLLPGAFMLAVWAFVSLSGRLVPNEEQMNLVGLAGSSVAFVLAFVVGIAPILNSSSLVVYGGLWAYSGISLVFLVPLWYYISASKNTELSLAVILVLFVLSIRDVVGAIVSVPWGLVWAWAVVMGILATLAVYVLRRFIRRESLPNWLGGLRLWFSGNSMRAYELGFSPRYWKLLAFVKRAAFWRDKAIFDVRRATRSARSETSIFLEIVRSVFWSALTAIAIVTVLTFVEHTVWEQIDAFGQFALLSRIDWTTFSAILTTLAQIAGVFLGLYFAALSIVATTVYGQVTSDVRELLLQDRVSHLAIRMIAILGAVCVFLLLSQALGFQPGILNLLLVGFLGVLSIFSIVVLTLRVFRLLDRTALLDQVVRQIAECIRSASFGGFQWDNAAFQQHYQRRAWALLGSYRGVVLLAIQEDPPKAESVKSAGRNALLLLRFYANRKPHVPSNSYWFSRVRRHPDWLTADQTRVELAVRTGTGMPPAEVPDRMWFEQQIESIVLPLTECLLKVTPRDAADLVYEVHETAGYLARDFAIDESFRLLNVLNAAVSHYVQSVGIDVKDTKAEDDKVTVALALIDACGFGIVSILVSLTQVFRAFTTESFAASVGGIDWHRPKTIHALKLPRHVIEQLEFMQRPLEFERKVEGRYLSPRWYQEQLACMGYLRFIAEATNQLIGYLESSVGGEADTLVSEKRHVYAAQHVQRGLEACNKFESYSHEASACFDRLVSLHRVSDIPRATIDWPDISDRVGRVREGLLANLAKCSIDLSILPRDESRPDYFGQTYFILAEACYSAMMTGNEVLFGKVFPGFFLSSTAAFDRLTQQLQSIDPQRRLVFSTESVADLLDISGFAYLYSELDGKGFWKIVTSIWDTYYQSRPDRKEFVGFLTSIVEYRHTIFAILPGDNRRTGWMSRFESVLRSKGLMKDEMLEHLPASSASKTVHPSPVIRLLARFPFSMYHAQDVFLTMYVFAKAEAAGLKAPRLTEEFGHALEFERKRSDSGNVSDRSENEPNTEDDTEETTT